jgi:hypothetical protein
MSWRPRAQAYLLLAQFGRECFAEIFRRKDLPDFDLGTAIEWRALHPIDCLIQRLRLDQPESRHQIAGQAERTAAHAARLAGISNACAFRTRVQAFAGQHDAGLHHLLVEFSHGGQ